MNYSQYQEKPHCAYRPCERDGASGAKTQQGFCVPVRTVWFCFFVLTAPPCISP